MTKADAARLVAIVVTAYPAYDKFRDEQAVEATVNLWARMFKDDDGAVVALALNKHIATSKWPPSVAEIREGMLEVQRPDLIPPDEAWATVSDLLHTTGGLFYGDLYAQLPELVARAVEVIGWEALWEMHRGAYGSGKPGMDRVAFLQQYTPAYEREKQKAMTPGSVTRRITASAAALLPGGRDPVAELRAKREREREQEGQRQRDELDRLRALRDKFRHTEEQT